MGRKKLYKIFEYVIGTMCSEQIFLKLNLQKGKRNASKSEVNTHKTFVFKVNTLYIYIYIYIYKYILLKSNVYVIYVKSTVLFLRRNVKVNCP